VAVQIPGARALHPLLITKKKAELAADDVGRASPRSFFLVKPRRPAVRSFIHHRACGVRSQKHDASRPCTLNKRSSGGPKLQVTLRKSSTRKKPPP